MEGRRDGLGGGGENDLRRGKERGRVRGGREDSRFLWHLWRY